MLTVQKQAYRFRILNACNDRTLNLGLFYADGGLGSGATATATILNGSVNTVALGVGGAGYTTAPGAYIWGCGGSGAMATTTLAPAAVAGITLVSGGSGYTSVPGVVFLGGGGTGAAATATLTGTTVTGITLNAQGSGYTTAPNLVFVGGGGGLGAMALVQLAPSAVAGIMLVDGGSGYTSVPNVTIGPSTEVKMVSAIPNVGLPPVWPTDGRDGGVLDPNTAGPAMIQIGTEGGFLPAPVVIPPTPTGYEYFRRSITVLNISTHGLLLGPAERADVIIDFTAVPNGSKLILYNDAPAPVPAFDPRIDYYTSDPDQTSTGGAPPTIPGYGPDTRTIMQFVVSGTPVAPTTVSLAVLQTALPAVFAASQPPPIVPETTYPAPYTATADTYSPIFATSLTFNPAGSVTPLTIPMLPKAIQELFELNYGRMNATMGVELPFTNFNTQTTIPYGYIDPPTEMITASPAVGPPVAGDGTQIWKITHNGVDTHFIHFHLFNVQVINRVGWDGTVKPPDANELGWKETVRMNPLEDAIVALRPTTPALPFGIPFSNRLLDVTWTPATAGIYMVEVWVRNSGSVALWDAHLQSSSFAIGAAPAITALTANVTSPVAVGTPITWTATATGGTPPPLQYEFWISTNGGAWSLLQAYGPSNSATFTPASAGISVVEVWVRSTGATVAWEAHRVSDGVSAGTLPTITGLAANVTSPALRGTPITWTVTATGGAPPPLQYQFWISFNGGAWTLLRGYGPTNNVI